jgi:hypothetical protein
MKHYPRQRTTEYEDYINARLTESKEAHKRTMQTGQAVQAEILEAQRQAFIDACAGYKGGFVVWFLVVCMAWLFLT